MVVIYKRTFPSEKCYIGQTRQKPEKRWEARGHIFFKQV